MRKSKTSKLRLSSTTVRALVSPTHVSAHAQGDTMTCTDPTYSICAAGCYPT